MKIENIKINGITDFLGYDTKNGFKSSWLVTETPSTQSGHAKLEVADTPDFKNPLFVREAPSLDCRGERLDFEPHPRTAYYIRVTVTDNAGDQAQGTARFETGKMAEAWEADWIGTHEHSGRHPVLRTQFAISGQMPPARARLYICGLGLYEAELNGEKIGDEFLTPYLNDYHTEYQVQAYDVTAMLGAQNTLEIHLGNGWYKGRFGPDGRSDNWGDCFAAIAELHMDYQGGSTQLVKTGRNWSYAPGNITHSGIYDGEHLDFSLPKGPSRQVRLVPLDKAKLTDRFSLPVKIMQELPVAAILHTPAGETVLDMGQNFAGFIRFTCNAPKGTKITLDFGEVLQNGCFYNDNYRSADARFVFTAGGSPAGGNPAADTHAGSIPAGINPADDTHTSGNPASNVPAGGAPTSVRPRFTFYGFRYVRVSGWHGELKAEDFTGCALWSAMETTGHFESSNPKLNRLFQNCVWGQRSNFIDMPTDCPQRDERLGWTGDAQAFAPTACFNMDTRAFYEKFLRDLRHEQRRMGGGIPSFIPNLAQDNMASSVWGDAATLIPMALYEQFGDADALKRHYPMMKDWVDYITRTDVPKKNLFHAGFHFGDWLALDGVTPQSMKGGTDDCLIASVYYHVSAKLTAKAARLLGYEDDGAKYEELAQAIRAAILEEYFTPSGRLSVDTQTAYLITLRFDVCRDRQKLLEQFLGRLKKDCYSIKCGFVGAPLLCDTLGQLGLEQLAVGLLLNEGFPGWLYAVNLGATTVWERWNSLLADGTCSGTGMNSFNHYAYGSVAQYLYAGLAGIRSTGPGFTRVRFAPTITGRLRHVSARYRSVSGEWQSEWRIHPNGQVSVRFVVPFGCAAEVVLPQYGGGPFQLTAGTFKQTYTPITDFRKIFSEQSRLDELAKDPRAMKILEEELPVILPRVQDPEFMANTLAEIKTMFYYGIRPEAVEKAVLRVGELIPKSI